MYLNATLLFINYAIQKYIMMIVLLEEVQVV